MSNTWLLLGRVGDLCTVLPFLKAEADAGEKPNLVVSNEYISLFDGVSYVTPHAFEGGLHMLREAFAWANERFPNVKSLQVIGKSDVVAEATYRPAGAECARMTSFVKEYWKLAGKMPLWDSCLPLVFDRRSPEREAELLQTFGLKGPGRKKKLVLLNVQGTSSPFPYADLLNELVQRRFAGQYLVEELPQAERFYDLLALYERAHCLVTIDSAPLHLARACPALPVIALTNDRPILWNGSAWQPNWNWCCRYHDFPERALQMLDAIRTCRDGSEFPFIHVWNEYDGKRKPKKFSRDMLPVFPGACGRDSANTMTEPRRVPYLKDCLRMGLQRAEPQEHVCLTHPDVEIQSLPEALPPAMFAYKIANGSFVPIADLFCASKEWWLERLSGIPDYLFGRDRYWAEGMWALFKKHGAVDMTGICCRAKERA